MNRSRTSDQVGLIRPPRGKLVLIGSGEIAPTMLSTHRHAIGESSTVTILDSPFGFQENADQLTDQIARFFVKSLNRKVEVVRLRNTTVDEVPRLRALSAIEKSEYLFAGPGSPTYALEVWRSTGADAAIRRRLFTGGTVVLASAAALTAGVKTIPVYEIYKVGSKPVWVNGMDLTTQFGLPIVVVPHWDNTEGGTHDTSHCYIGERRFALLESELEVGVIGIDEHTAATIDFESDVLTISGNSSVTLRGSETVRLAGGDSIELTDARQILGTRVPHIPELPKEPRRFDFRQALFDGDLDRALSAVLEEAPVDATDLRSMIIELGSVAGDGLVEPRDRVGGFVDLMLRVRADARSGGDYQLSDTIRDGLARLGVEVRDTADGVEWEIREGAGRWAM